MGTVEYGREIRLKMTRDELEVAYLMWKLGASAAEVAKVFKVNDSNLRFCLIVRDTGHLEKYTVHYKDSNQPTM